ncbi:MAG: NAD(P)/FAD-dependent oxidoreductase, partial [Thermoleophilaceae bacterium]|nr:NAD(P)/FAD-dependent oxidoreductase [Thermoleophilaceae bacterium]
VLVRGGRAHGVRLEGGEEIHARRAVLADVGAPQLYEQLLEPAEVPGALRDDLRRFQYDTGTVKVDWALDGPIPWSAPDARRAGTVHVADGIEELSGHALEIVRGELPTRPFLLLGQYAHFDPTRAPAGREAAWAYTHVPQGLEWDAGRAAGFADRMEEQVESRAPGFRALIRSRHVFTPDRLEAANRNLVGGALNGGTAQLHQTLVFRPTPGLGRAETPVRGLYLASASAHPGGGVHGACGANAARAALRWSGLRR